MDSVKINPIFGLFYMLFSKFRFFGSGKFQFECKLCKSFPMFLVNLDDFFKVKRAKAYITLRNHQNLPKTVVQTYFSGFFVGVNNQNHHKFSGAHLCIMLGLFHCGFAFIFTNRKALSGIGL